MAPLIIAAWLAFLLFGFIFSSYQWSDLKRVLSSYPARLSVLIPIFGYLILFNDDLLSYVSFNRLAGEEFTFFEDKSELYYIYFGLTFSSLSSILYQGFCPSWIKLTLDKHDFMDRYERSLGSYFVKGAVEQAEKVGFHTDKHDERAKEFENDLKTMPFNDAIQKNRNFLNDLLDSVYRSFNRSRFFARLLIILMLSMGTAMLAIPSVDLFWHVLREAAASGFFELRISE